MGKESGFDPYRNWLRIPASQLPPDHYTLLGLKRFENDRDEIKRRADERVRQVEGYRRSGHAKLCEEVLYRVNIARTTLMNPSTKSAYDRKLEAEPAKKGAVAGPQPTEHAGTTTDSPSPVTKEKNIKDEIAEIESMLAPVPEDESPQDDMDDLLLGETDGPGESLHAAAPSPAVPQDDLDNILDSSVFEGLDDLDSPNDVPATKPAASAPPDDLPLADPEVDPLSEEGEGLDDLDRILADSAFGADDDLDFPMDDDPDEADPFDAAANEDAPPPERASKAVNRAAPPSKEEGGKQPNGTEKSVRRDKASGAPGRAPAARRGLAIPADAGYEVLPSGDGAETVTTGATRQRTANASPNGKAKTGGGRSSTKRRSQPQTAKESKKKEPQQPARRRKVLLTAMAAACVLALGLYLARDRLMGASAPQEPPPIKAALPTGRPKLKLPKPDASKAVASSPEAAADVKPAEPPGPVEFGIAYGTEKKKWLQWAAKEFAATDEGKQVRVKLIPMGSLESAHAIIDGDERIHVWAPASSLYRSTFLRDWSGKYGCDPILKEERLALTPMVIVMWKSRYDAFVARAPEVSLTNLKYAMHTPRGWESIAGRQDWGRFKLAHTHPNQSNSGLVTLALLAYEFHQSTSGLTVEEVMTPAFQKHLESFATGVVEVPHSTGTLMKDMVLMGPSRYDAVIVYESLAIEYLKSAEGRWGKLQVIYPKFNLWSDNPYCVLNAPWSSAEQKEAAEKFLRFLLSEPIQARALEHGFRPGNPAVPVLGPESPFETLTACGLKVDVPEMCEVPSLEVMENLQMSWIRSRPTSERAWR